LSLKNIIIFCVIIIFGIGFQINLLSKESAIRL
jgi:hypothetical protein